MKLSEIKKLSQYSVETKELGVLNCRHLGVGNIAKLAEQLEGSVAPSPDALVRDVLVLVATKQDGTTVTKDDAEKLEPAELEDFAEGFMRIGSLLRGRESVTTDPNSEKTSHVLDMDSLAVPREDEESAVAYLGRVLPGAVREANKRLSKRHERLKEQMDQSIARVTGWIRSDAVEALKRNARLSQQLSRELQSTLGSKNRLTPTITPVPNKTFDLKLPRNPILDTNERLDEVIQRFDQLEGAATTAISLVQGINEAASSILTTFAEGAQAAEVAQRKAVRGQTIATGLAVIAILASLCAAWYQVHADDVRSKQDEAGTKFLVGELGRVISNGQIQALANLESSLAAALRAAQSEYRDAVVQSVERGTAISAERQLQQEVLLRELNTALRGIQDQLKQLSPPSRQEPSP